VLPLCCAALAQPLQLDTTPRKLDCKHLDLLTKDRQPVFVGRDDEVRIGISTQKNIVAPGEPILVDLWVDNRTDRAAYSGGRCILPYRHAGDVFDEWGHRLIGIQEQAALNARKRGIELVEVCSMSELVSVIPPHTCMGPIDAREDGLRLDHELKPGVYYVFPRSGTDPALFKQGLVITVRQP